MRHLVFRSRSKVQSYVPRGGGLSIREKICRNTGLLHDRFRKLSPANPQQLLISRSLGDHPGPPTPPTVVDLRAQMQQHRLERPALHDRGPILELAQAFDSLLTNVFVAVREAPPLVPIALVWPDPGCPGTGQTSCARRPPGQCRRASPDADRGAKPGAPASLALHVSGYPSSWGRPRPGRVYRRRRLPGPRLLAAGPEKSVGSLDDR